MEISIAALEAAAAGGWRGTEEDRLGDWLLRAACGFTGRANSALAVGDPGLPLDAAVRRVCAWYRARGLPPMIATAYPLGQPERSEIDRLLAGLGWPARDGAATVMTAAPGALARPSAAVQVHIAGQPDDGWLARYRYRGQRPPPVSGRLLMSAPWQAFGSVREDGRTVAVGRVAVAGEWAGLTAVEVHPACRRRGLATAITTALAAAAADRGAKGIYLQVADDNGPARALYRRAGFADHHAYHYRIAPAG